MALSGPELYECIAILSILAVSPIFCVALQTRVRLGGTLEGG